MRPMWTIVALAGMAAVVVPLLASGQQKFDLGKREYESNCASCHGLTGKGDGPVSSWSEVGVSDLTALGTDSATARALGGQRTILVPKDDGAAQLRIICGELPEPPTALLFTRCVICNVPVVAVPKNAVHGSVPEAVYASTERYTRCPSCERIYWEGTHTARLRRRLALLLGTVDDDRP